MYGTVTTTTANRLKIHTYTSPEAGLDANTHILELDDQLLVVDTQYALPFAAEAAQYAASLGKPITRVYISHAHPDHFFGAGEFDAPVHALDSVRRAIEEAGEPMRARNRELAGDIVPDHLTPPTETVTPGVETIGDVRLEFREVQHTEAEHMLVIALPDESIVLAQDLAYNNLHLFIAEGNLEGWDAAVAALQEERFAVVLPGHGLPGNAAIFGFVREYLAAAAPIQAANDTPDALKAALIEAFPNAGGVGLLDIQNSYMFPPTQ